MLGVLYCKGRAGERGQRSQALVKTHPDARSNLQRAILAIHLAAQTIQGAGGVMRLISPVKGPYSGFPSFRIVFLFANQSIILPNAKKKAETMSRPKSNREVVIKQFSSFTTNTQIVRGYDVIKRKFAALPHFRYARCTWLTLIGCSQVALSRLRRRWAMISSLTKSRKASIRFEWRSSSG